MGETSISFHDKTSFPHTFLSVLLLFLFGRAELISNLSKEERKNLTINKGGK